MTALVGLAVTAYGKGGLKPAHACDKVGLGCFKKDVVMVIHDGIGMDLPSKTNRYFSQCIY